MADIIAIDGPAASGKSTVARELAARLGFTLIDTGAMYRAVTLEALENGVPLTDENRLSRVARLVRDNFRVSRSGDDTLRFWLGEREITGEIRSPEVGSMVSPVSSVGAVRGEMVALQREMASGGNTVVEGRDIGSQVFPEASLKIFLETSVEERTERRHEELLQKGISIAREEVRREIESRDRADSSRENSPLTISEDAVFIDTTGMSAPGVVDEILKICRERGIASS